MKCQSPDALVGQPPPGCVGSAGCRVRSATPQRWHDVCTLVCTLYVHFWCTLSWSTFFVHSLFTLPLYTFCTLFVYTLSLNIACTHSRVARGLMARFASTWVPQLQKIIMTRKEALGGGGLFQVSGTRKHPLLPTFLDLMKHCQSFPEGRVMLFLV